MKNIAIAFVAVALGVELILLLSGFRVLVSEGRVPPGTTVALKVEMFEKQDRTTDSGTFVCRYFTGRRIVTRVLDDFLGRDECPFIVGP